MRIGADRRPAEGSQKRSHPVREAVPGLNDVVSPPRKRVNQNYAHFRPGYEVDSRIADIPQCAYRIIDKGHQEYLPLHYFDPSIRAQERRALLVPAGGDVIVPRARITEDTMSTGQYNSWSRQHIAALEALGVLEHVVNMFRCHYTFVQSRIDIETAWTTWREYDLERRAQVVGLNPPDIGGYAHDTYREIERKAAARLREQLEASLAGVGAGASTIASTSALSSGFARNVPRAPRAMLSAGASGSGSGAPSTAANPFEELKYACCFLCGSRVHQMSKDGRKHAKCAPKWLAWDGKRSVPAWVTPDTDKIVCWAWNSPKGCKKDTCRLRGAGHRCSLCGDSSHNCHGH